MILRSSGGGAPGGNVALLGPLDHLEQMSASERLADGPTVRALYNVADAVWHAKLAMAEQAIASLDRMAGTVRGDVRTDGPRPMPLRELVHPERVRVIETLLQTQSLQEIVKATPDIGQKTLQQAASGILAAHSKDIAWTATSHSPLGTLFPFFTEHAPLLMRNELPDWIQARVAGLQVDAAAALVEQGRRNHLFFASFASSWNMSPAEAVLGRNPAPSPEHAAAQDAPRSSHREVLVDFGLWDGTLWGVQ